MAWKKNIDTLTRGSGVYWEETLTLPGGAAQTVYTAEIGFIGVSPTKTRSKVLIEVVASAVSGTNVDVALVGAYTKSGTKTTLVAALVAALTDATPALASVDLNDEAAMVYYISFLADADESANNVTVRIYVPT